ncbi:unnamed protein product [Vitrella brassicaformis CCMP3155]|uniref:Uncharacterized protein n=1 Tax=Vitrella brassicaformis (strain CCMP3155) TaxID=1169540 RepID=A0A0G4GLU6_VITBC|nr:unnamed protein product [Vitrella brassicaformis CCMP3155]|eukprot:CEM31092.1 unnamed protein product [Vitrella brassicaformis CCMP3155]
MLETIYQSRTGAELYGYQESVEPDEQHPKFIDGLWQRTVLAFPLTTLPHLYKERCGVPLHLFGEPSMILGIFVRNPTVAALF